MRTKASIIGAGFSSLAAASYLAQAGYEVTIFEKNSTPGGRARQLRKEGFTFDMGPTWYWMPDVFERFFNDFGKHPKDYYTLEKLDPAYKVFFGPEDEVSIPAGLEAICKEFDKVEPGSSAALKKFIAEAEDNYNIAIKDLVYRPGVSPTELMTPATFKKLRQFFTTIQTEVRRSFKNEKLVAILEFPVLFLGAKPSKTPGFYSFMNYADFGLGTFHPKTGMFAVVDGMLRLAQELGVEIRCDQEVSQIMITDGEVDGLVSNGEEHYSDIVLSGADYHHSETLVETKYRQYSNNYWEKKVFAPAALLFYVGFDKKIKNVAHHSLFFDVPFDVHAKSIYDTPSWPEEPLFYASFPSITDNSAAPDGKEAGIFLIPLAPDLMDIPELREEYFEKIITRFEQITGDQVRKNIIFKESFCINDFKEAYHSYKGNAYGLANTLLQTAFLRPKLRSGKVKNLYFTGQLTVPGPGVPPALISGKLAAQLILKDQN